MAKGTLFVPDLTRSYLAGTPNESVIGVGEDAISAQVLARLNIHNRQVQQMMDAMVVRTDRDNLPWGGYEKQTMTQTDEPGTAPPVKGQAGYIVGLPLDHYEIAWQGSFHWLRRVTPRGLAIQMQGILDADARNLIAKMLKAFMDPTNRNVVDVLTNNGVSGSYQLPIKALVNADGLAIPPGPNGETFNPSTHTHYAAETGFTAAAVAATIETVREHTRDSQVQVWIPRGLEAGIRGMTSNFIPYVKSNVRPANTSASIVDPSLDIGNTGDRAIGEFDGAPVIIKPVMPSGYLVAIETNAAAKVIGMRIDPALDNGDLALAAESEEHPLYAKTWYRDFGMGCVNRTGAAVLKPNNADTTYVAPTSYGI